MSRDTDVYAARMAEANELARQRATQWRVWNEKKNDYVIIDAASSEAAIIEFCDRLGLRRSEAPEEARPQLKSSQWQSIYEEVGL